MERTVVAAKGVRVAALIPAAGDGVRLGRGPKAFLPLAGRTLLERAVDAFGGHADEIVVAVSSPMVDGANELVGERARVIVGGTTRQESVFNLLNATDAGIVLIHDAARPFLAAGVIEALAQAVLEDAAASVVIPVADTLIEAETGAAVDRQKLRAVQTPQGFSRPLLLDAHHHALSHALQHTVSATDDAGLVRLLGHTVALVEGSSWLMKVTTPADLEIATALAAVWDRTT